MPLQRLKDRINSSLRLKLSLLITLLTAFLTIVFSTVYIVHERHSYMSELTAHVTLLAEFLANDLKTPLYAGYYEDIAHRSSVIISNRNISSLRVFDSSRELIAHAVRNDSMSAADSLKVTKTVTSNFSDYSPEALLLGEYPPEQILGTVELTVNTGQVHLLTRKLIMGSCLIAFIFWLAVSGLTYFFLRKVTATFQLLMSGVRNIEAGDFSTKLPVIENDEPGRALAAINSLAEALQKKNTENILLQAEVVKGLRLQIDEEKNRHMAKLIQTNRMTSLGLLVSSMAHEINNPNGAIRLAAEILERGWKDILPILNEVAVHEEGLKVCGMPCTDALEDIEKAVEAILRSSVRIETVVQNLRTYSIGNREKQIMEFDLNRVAENSVAIVRAHGKMEKIIINTELTSELPAAKGNPFQLEQVVTNLLLNAIQALSVNGSNLITLSTGTDPESGELLLVVRDSGPGIAAENLPHIFEPFFSTRIETGGSGLGLYIADFIVREQKGTLTIHNTDSGGCSAEIRLPTLQTVTLQTS